MEEIFKDIPDYEGLYQVSNLGRIKSLPRKVCNYRGCYMSKEKILKITINIKGYCVVGLFKNNKLKLIRVHQLVAMTFLNHIPDGTHKFVVDHINDNKLDNRLENLQIVTNRENVFKTQGKYSSQYKGVSWCKTYKKWKAQIFIKNKSKFLGYFIDEYEAHLKYQEALQDIK